LLKEKLFAMCVLNKQKVVETNCLTKQKQKAQQKGLNIEIRNTARYDMRLTSKKAETSKLNKKKENI
jgi:hypothetical protein